MPKLILRARVDVKGSALWLTTLAHDLEARDDDYPFLLYR